VASRFDGRLPFLVKLLAAERPLSIQVHPTLEQARAGYAAEDARGIARDAPERNYRDRNHKPEMLCALTPFDALCGFRPVAETIAFLDEMAVSDLDEVRALLAGPDGLRAAFTHLLGRRGDVDLVHAVVTRAAQLSESGRWAAAVRAVGLIADEYPDDVGVVLSLLLNAVTLAPGEAIYLGAGNVHCYLRGLGVEVLANSDNVLRCALTPKHVDVAEVLQITDFTPLAQPRMRAMRDGPRERYPAPVADFEVSVAHLDEVDGELGVAGPQLVLCISGTAEVAASGATVALAPGRAAMPVTAQGTGAVVLAGPRILY
jgi:mannose-6-phosphate isomerase